MEAILRVKYYSTGKSPYLKGRGKPVVTDSITAAILLQKGSIVSSLDELNGTVKVETPNVVEHPDIIPTVTVEVRDIPKVERKPKAEKKVKPKRVVKKVTKK
jgi:hypothetical protein